MKEDSLNKLISNKVSMLMIKSKDLSKGLNIKFWHSKDDIVRCLSAADKAKLLDAMRKNSALFLERVINLHMDGQQIISFTKGGRSLLPTNYQRFYDRCVAVETENYKLYINDKAIDKCEHIIYKLDKRSKKDCFNFAKDKLESGEAKHLYISLTSGYAETGRSTFFEGENQEFVSNFFPINSVGYSSYPKEDGTYDEDDINNILTLIEEFTKARGLFEDGKYNSTDMVMYNRGSMKIEGIDKDKRLKEKVFELIKKER